MAFGSWIVVEIRSEGILLVGLRPVDCCCSSDWLWGGWWMVVVNNNTHEAEQGQQSKCRIKLNRKLREDYRFWDDQSIEHWTLSFRVPIYQPFLSNC